MPNLLDVELSTELREPGSRLFSLKILGQALSWASTQNQAQILGQALSRASAQNQAQINFQAEVELL